MLKRKRNTRHLVLAALFLALCLLLPFLTGQIPEIGNMLCPMHIPVMLCAFFGGPLYAGAVGVIAPILRSLLFTMPPLFPVAAAMSFELFTYGFVAGVIYRMLIRKSESVKVYASLLCAMIAGRLVWGIATAIFYSVLSRSFGLGVFWTSAVMEALPGIIIQLILVPLIVISVNKAKPRAELRVYTR